MGFGGILPRWTLSFHFGVGILKIHGIASRLVVRTEVIQCRSKWYQTILVVHIVLGENKCHSLLLIMFILMNMLSGGSTIASRSVCWAISVISDLLQPLFQCITNLYQQNICQLSSYIVVVSSWVSLFMILGTFGGVFSSLISYQCLYLQYLSLSTFCNSRYNSILAWFHVS